MCFICALFCLCSRGLDYSADIQELFSFLGIGTKQLGLFKVYNVYLNTKHSGNGNFFCMYIVMKEI